MSQNFIALDFGSGQISAVLTVYDEDTGTCRVRHAARVLCPAVSACYILDFNAAVRAVGRLLEEMSDYAAFTPTVAVGLRGDFLSFRRAGGCQSVEGRNHVITERDVRAALDNSVPANLDENLEVVDLRPQTFTIDGKTGVQNPVGLVSFFLEAETFLSVGLRSHLANLNRVMAAAGCEDFEAVPTVLALCESLLKPEEKKSGVLLLDIGAANSSAALYHKGMLEDAREMPFGADVILQEVAEVLQNDLDGARQALKNYSYGDDEIMDDVLDEAARKLLLKVQAELRQSLPYIKYAPAQAVLSGGGAGLHVKNAAKSVLGLRRARIGAHDDLISDGEDLLAPQYTSALSLALYSQKHGGRTEPVPSAKEKAAGFFDRMLAKLGLN